MPAPMEQGPTSPNWTPTSCALAGVALAFIGGLFIAQAGGGDREAFLSIGSMLGAAGLLGIIIGGVAIGIRMARD
jgi:hypothetical protein